MRTLAHTNQGFGAAHKVAIQTAVSDVSILPAAMSYDDPIVSSASPANGPIAGRIVTMYGVNLGTWSQNMTATVQGKSANVAWTSDTALHVQVIGKDDRDIDGYMEIAGRVVSAYCDGSQPACQPGKGNSFSYVHDLPEVYNSSRTSGATLGGYKMNVTGINFGLSSSTDFRVQVGPTTCTSSTWISDTSAVGVVPGGTGVGHRVLVHRKTALGVNGPIFSFFAPTVTSLVPDHVAVAAVGAREVTMHGSGFGPSPPLDMEAWVGNTLCANVHYISDSSLRCSVALGRGASLTLKVKISMQETSAPLSGPSVLFSYDAPVVTQLGFNIGPSTGHPALPVAGLNFGASQPNASDLTVRVGDTLCSSVQWTSDTALKCAVVGGPAGSTADVAVTFVGQTSAAGSQARLDFVPPPVVTAVRKFNNPNSSFTESGGMIEIYGSNFGLQLWSNFDQSLRYFDATPAARVGFSDCTSTRWLSASSVRCFVVAGMGLSHAVSVQVNAGTSTLQEAFNYTLPHITAVHPNVLAAGSGFGASVITFTGAKWPDLTPMLRVGRTACSASIWISASSITCKVPLGFGGNLAAVVTVSQAVSTYLGSVSYVAPSITAISDLSQAYATSGSATISVLGEHMGTRDHGALDVVIGESKCLTTSWQSATSLLCTVPPGVGVDHDVSLAVSGFTEEFCLRVSGSCQHFSYRAPTLTSVVPSEGTSAGGDIVTLHGFDFGETRPNAVAAFIGPTACVSTVWLNSSSVKCTTPRGALHDQSVSIQISGQTHALEKAFNFGAPSCAAIADAEPSAQDGFYLLGSDLYLAAFVGASAEDKNVSMLKKVWCNIQNIRAGATGRLGLDSKSLDSLILWLDASTASDLDVSGPDGRLHSTPAFVDRWQARAPLGAVGLPEEYDGSRLRPGYSKNGVVVFDGVDDALVTSVRRGTKNATVIVAFSPNFDTLPNGKCPSGANPANPVIDGRKCAPGWIISDNDLSNSQEPRGLGIHVGVDGLVQAVVGRQTGFYAAKPVKTLDNGCFHILTFETSATHVKMWMDGSTTPDLAFETSLDGRAGNVNLTVGARGTHYISGGAGVLDQDHFAGQVSEVVVMDTVLDEAQRARVHRALVSRWQCQASPPADGGQIAVNVASVVQESSSTHVEVERIGGSDGYASLSFLFAGGTALYGVPGGFKVLNGTDGSGSLSWNHGEKGNRVLVLKPIQDHAWSGSKNLTITFDVIYAEFMVHLQAREKVVTIENNDPRIDQVFPRHGPTVGSTTVTVTGLGFKRNDTLVSERQPDDSILLKPVPLMYDIHVGDTRCRRLHWVSETSLTCVTAPGAGGALTVRVNVAGNFTDEPAAFDYDAPAGIQCQPLSAPTTAIYDSDTVVLTVTGANFGITNYNATVQIGATRCMSTWTSDTSMKCTLAPGVGVDLDVNVSVYAGTEREITGKAAVPWSYQRPVIGSAELKTQTGALPRVVINGHGFGTADYTPVAFVGVTACTETRWITDRYLTCLVPPGSGVNQHFDVRVAGAVSRRDDNFTFTYLASPRVDGVSQMVWSDAVSADASISARVTVTGAHFGISNTIPRVLMGDTVAVQTSWISDSSVSAQVARGVGKSLPIAVQVYAQKGVSNTFFSYQVPVVTHVNPETGPPAGNFSITVTGSYFGDYDYNQTVLIDEETCLKSRWISNTAMFCIAPAGYGLVPVAVNAGGNVGSRIEMFQYAGAASGRGICPLADVDCSAQTQPRRTAGGDVLRVYGEAFGPNVTYAPGAFKVVVGESSCQQTTWVSQSAVDCVLAPGTGADLDVTIMIDLFISKMKRIFAYDQPVIEGLTPPHLSTTANATISVHGINFGTFCANASGQVPSLCALSVTVGATVCDEIKWFSDTTVTCRVAKGVGLDLPVKVSVDSVEGSSSNTSSFSYDAPIVHTVNPASVPDYGGINVTLSGKNFGFEPPSSPGILVLVGSTACQPVVWKSDSEVICRVAAGLSGIVHTEGVAASVKGNFRPVGDPPVEVSYFPAPTISSFAPRKISLVGGKPLTIHGNWFLPRTNEPAPFVTVAGRPCPLLDVPRTINLLVCTSPALDDGPWTVKFTVGNRIVSKVLEPAPPLVTSVTAITPAIKGGAPMTIYGSNFGVAAPAVLEGIVNRQKCSPLEWVSETSIECSIPKGLPSTATSIVVRRAGLEGVPFYFSATDPEAPKPRTAVGLVSKGSAVQLVSVDVVDGSVKELSSFRLGAVDYGMAGYDPESNEFKVFSVMTLGSYNYTSISPEQGAADASFGLDLRQAGGTGRRLLQEHPVSTSMPASLFSFGGSKFFVETPNTVLTNVEYDQRRQNLVGTLVHKGTELVIFDTLTGSARVHPIANANVAYNVRALDTAASNFFVILEGVDQRLLIVSTDPDRNRSVCESFGGVCQAASGGKHECVHIAAADSEANVIAADAICTALGALCQFTEWVQTLGMYVMRTRGVASMSCQEPQILYGPVMHGVRAMTFDVQRERLLLIIEDVNGVHRTSPEDNFVLAEMDIRSIAPLPKLSIYERVYNRRLLAQYTFWERDTFWPSEGMGDSSAEQVAMPATKVVTGFGARRVIPGFMVLLYSRGLALVQEEPDAVRAFNYLPRDPPAASDSSQLTEASILRNEKFRGLRALFPVEDLLLLTQPRIEYVSPSLVSAQGTTEITIMGSNFGVQDSSPTIRVNGRECGTSQWISSVELLCTNVPAMPSGSLLDLVGGHVQFARNSSVVYFPEALKYVSSAVASAACCRTCACPYEIWTTESSGHHTLRLLLSQVVSDQALQLCGPSPRSCSLTFVDGNSELLIDGSLMMDLHGSLQFDLAAFQNGHAVYELSVTDGYVEARKNISIVSRAVNNAPSVTLNNGGDLYICEDGADSGRLSQISFAQVSAGASTIDELAQEVTIEVTPASGDFAALFQNGSMPMIYPGSGVLSFKLVPDQYGSASFNVSVRDNGGRGTRIPGTPPSCGTPGYAGTPVSCNWDEGPIVPLTIHVTRQNTAPHFNYGSLVSLPASVSVDGQGLLTIWEGAGELMLDGFVTNIDPGSRAEEAGQSVSFSVTRVSSNLNILMQEPVIHANGSLTVTPGVNINGRGGVEMFLVTLTDDGPVTCNGSNAFARNLTVAVDYVNHPPTLSLHPGTAVTVKENECSLQACSVPNFLMEYSAGVNEAWQSTSFVVHIPLVTRSDCTDFNLFDPTAFSASGKSNPHIDESGALVFSVVRWCSGVALVEMEVVDSGGTARGGVNRSDLQAFNITIESVDQPPSFVLAYEQVSVESGDYTLQTRASFAPPSDMSQGAPDGRDVLQTLGFTLAIVQQTALPGINGGLLFAVEPSLDVQSGDLTFRIADGQFGSATVNVTLQDGGLFSFRKQITIVCQDLNNPPILTFASSTFSVYESSGANGPMLLFSNVNPGFADRAQKITFTVLQIGGAVGLFTAGPSVNCIVTQTSLCSSADLRFKVADYRWGNATFQVVAIDDGPGVDGHQNTAAPVSFTIAVLPVNSIPTFELPAPELQVNQGSWCVEGPASSGSGDCSYSAGVYVEDMDKWHVRRNFASSIRMGGADHTEVRAAASYVHGPLNLPLTVVEEACPLEPCSRQRATFAVVAHDLAAANHLFVSPPSMVLDGSLIFALRDNTNGVATFSITLTDDGGGVTAGLTSVSSSFTIRVLPVNAAPEFKVGVPIIFVQPYAMAQETRNFLQNISIGPADEADQTFVVLLHVKASDRSLFTAAGLPRYRAYENSLFFIPAATVPASTKSIEVQVEVQDTGGNVRALVPGWSPKPLGSDNSTVMPFNITFVGAALPSVGGGDTWSKMSSAYLPSAADGVALSPRLGHAVVEFMGDIWVLGGYATPKDNASAPWRPATRRLLTEESSQYLLSDVWRLRQVTTGICRQSGLCLEQARVQQHAWPARHSHAALAFGNRIWIMGGVTALAVPAHDVWSSYDGVHWQLTTATAGWSARFGMAVETVANPGGPGDVGIMIISGGGSYTGDGHVMYNDVWTSIDGKDWRLASADAAWTPRARHSMASLRGPEGNVTLWLVGGEEVSGSTRQDVWYSDDEGGTWKLAAGSAPWLGRAGHAMVRYRGQLFLTAGRTSALVNIDLDQQPILRDVWKSADGRVWEQVLDEAPFDGREDFGMAVHPASDRLVIVGGQGQTARMADVWVSPQI